MMWRWWKAVHHHESRTVFPVLHNQRSPCAPETGPEFWADKRTDEERPQCAETSESCYRLQQMGQPSRFRKPERTPVSSHQSRELVCPGIPWGQSLPLSPWDTVLGKKKEVHTPKVSYPKRWIYPEEALYHSRGNPTELGTKHLNGEEAE